MNIRRLWLLTFLCMVSLAAQAQWQWVDKSGRKVFSDQPPPAEVPESAIQRRPGGPKPLPVATVSTAGTAAPAGAASKPAAPASASKGSGKDPELEKKKAQAEAQAAAKKKEDDDKASVSRADNCERAKRNLATLQSGMRVAQTNANGEREFLSDEARNAEAQRAQGIVNSDCQGR